MLATDSARRRKKGFVIILTTLTLFVTVPMVGLAIDLSTLYFIRTKLSTALDAAVLAGARALGTGSTPAQQAASAQAAAQRFFNANFPSGYWGTSSLNFAPPVVDDTSSATYRTVTATASLSAPLYFMRILGQTSSVVAASSAASRRDAIIVLVLDRSGSMDYSMGGGLTACDVMKTDAVDFLGNFALGRDMVGLVVFDSNVFTVAPTKNFSTLSTQIKSLDCGGHTATSLALSTGYQLLKTVATSTTANFIVLETDGRPNSLVGDFTTYRVHPSTCDSTSAPLVGVLSPGGSAPTDSGATIGVLGATTASIATNWDFAANNSSGCAFGPPGQKNTSVLDNMPTEISSMPPKDFYGNSLAGNYTVQNSNYPYNGQGAQLNKVNSPRQIIMAATNALDNQATSIRLDTTLKPTIMTIALEGTSTSGDIPDTLLLRKMANDATMKDDSDPLARSFYTLQKDQTAGFFALAPSPDQLAVAFNSIAQQIVIRLSN